jgi:pimeloyl-ACP methyl ester carboxylesterase
MNLGDLPIHKHHARIRPRSHEALLPIDAPIARFAAVLHLRPLKLMPENFNTDSPSPMKLPPGSADAPPADEVLPATGEGCPTPLAWKQVQNEFLSQSDEFSFSEAGLTISGRVLGEGPPLYFLNGISATPTLFCLAVWLLRDEFRCVILGYPPEAQTLTQLAQSLDLAATRFGDEQFDLYATSFGTSVALHAMQSFPQRIQHAVLQGPLISMKFSMAERLALATLGWLPGQIDCLPLRQTVLQNNHARWFPPFDITRLKFLLAETGNVPTRDVARRITMLRGLDLTNQISSLETPTLVVSSEGEAARHRESAAVLAEKLPNARAEEISNTGHVPFVTHPHRLAKLVRQFLHPELHAESCNKPTVFPPA